LPYPLYLNLIPLFAGILEPLVALCTLLVRPFLSRRWPARSDSPRRRRRGLTLILGGIEGPSHYAIQMARGLLKAGYRGSVELFPWNRGIPFLCWFRNLTDRRHHEEQADRLVRRILEYRQQHPAVPVCILAQSGGCWITVRALERLPAGVRVWAAVLLAPSISPAYDITTASAKCENGLVSIGGPGDLFFLALATTILGTSDRVHTPAAGWIGWHHYHVPGFTEVRWHPSWLRYGYLGNHTTISAVRFIQHVVAPRFKARCGFREIACSRLEPRGERRFAR
jgi:hypothetical protein